MIRWNCRKYYNYKGFGKQITAARSYNQDSRPFKCTNIATLLRSSSDALAEHPRHIVVNGFIRSIRKQKHVAFAILDDGSSLEALQAVFKPEQVNGLSNGSAVTISGIWQKHPAGKKQTYELQVEDVKRQGYNDATTNPIQKKYHTPEFLRTIPHLRTRIPHNSVLLRLRSQVIHRISTYFAAQGFVQTHTPIITSSDCEGAGEVFSVSSSAGTGKVRKEEFFQSPKYMTVSSQLHLEALAQSVGKVWTLSPTFRAEKSDTARHLSEFYMLEAEVSFVENLDEVMNIVENVLRDVATYLKTSDIGNELLTTYEQRLQNEKAQVEISYQDLSTRWDGLTKGPWPRITYAQAVKLLQDAVAHNRARFEFPPEAEAGLQAEHEKYLAKIHQGPVFVTDYPRTQKPFYMAPSPNSSLGLEKAQTVACFDLLFPEVCEVVGGSMREHRYDYLFEAMYQRGMIRDRAPNQKGSDVAIHGEETTTGGDRNSTLDWYLDLRRFGSVPHGGFGMGFDRVLGYLAGVSNIRDIVTFPRWYGRCEC